MNKKVALPERLAAALAQAPPLVQHFQTAPDSWQLSWRQSPERLRYLFAQTDNEVPVRRCCSLSSSETSKLIHFRQQINVECGIVDILVESDHYPDDGFVLTALVGFSPHNSESALPEAVPAMRVDAEWGNFTQRLVIEDGNATFPLVTRAQLGCVTIDSLPPLTVTLATATA